MEINKKIKIWGVVLLVVVGVAGGVLIFSRKTNQLFKGSQIDIVKFGEGANVRQNLDQFRDENIDNVEGEGGKGIMLAPANNVQLPRLIVSRAADNPAAKTITGGTIEEVARFNFEVQNSFVTVTKIKIKRKGTTTKDDIPYIALADTSNHKLTPSPFNAPKNDAPSEYEASIVPPLVIQPGAGTNKVVVVKAMIKQEVEENTFSLSIEAGGITTDNQTEITGLPVESNQMTIEPTEPPPPAGPPTAPADGVLMKAHDQPIPAGQAQAGTLVKVMKIKVEAGVEGIKRLDRILLRREGSADSNEIPKLKVAVDDDNTVGDEDIIRGEGDTDGNMYTVVFQPPGLSITAGQTRNILIFAEISPRATGGRTFKITINSTSDLVARLEGNIQDTKPVVCEGCPLQSAEFTIIAADPRELCENSKTAVQNEINNRQLDSEQIGDLVREPNEQGCNFNIASFSYSQCRADKPIRRKDTCFTQQELCTAFKDSLAPEFQDDEQHIVLLETLLAEKNPLLGCNITVQAVRDAKADFCPANKPVRYEGQCFAQDELCTATKANLIAGVQSGGITAASLAERLSEINTATGCTLVVADIIPAAATPAPGTSTPQTAAATGTTTAATGTTTAAAAPPPPPPPPPPPAPSGTQEITVGASLPVSQKAIIPPQQNQIVQLISIDVGATGNQAQAGKLKRIVLGYAGTFDVSKISELHLFREDGTEFGVGPFNKELTSLSKNPINGTVEIIFATTDPNATVLSAGRRLVLYGKVYATTDDAGKVIKYEIKAVETDPSTFSKMLIAVAGPEIGILSEEKQTVATVTPPPPLPPAVAAEPEDKKAKAKAAKKTKELTKAEQEQAALLAQLQKSVGELKTAAAQPQAGAVAGAGFAGAAAAAQPLRPVAASTGLAGSQRLVRAPERSGTGPGVLVYFGILAAVQGGLLIRRARAK